MKKRMDITLDENMIKALNFYTEYMKISRSALISIALSEYLMNKDEFRNNPKMRELLSEEIKIYEMGMKNI